MRDEENKTEISRHEQIYRKYGLIPKTDYRGNPLKEGVFYCHGWIGPGWEDLVEDLIKDLIELGWNREVAQIKEKFGGLRFYINSGSEEIFSRIMKAESKSYKICEQCGRDAEPQGSSWIRTLCEVCFEVHEKEQAVRKQKAEIAAEDRKNRYFESIKEFVVILEELNTKKRKESDFDVPPVQQNMIRGTIIKYQETCAAYHFKDLQQQLDRQSWSFRSRFPVEVDIDSLKQLVGPLPDEEGESACNLV